MSEPRGARQHPSGRISLTRRLSDLAAAAPDRPAVTCAGESLTRSELVDAADRLARDLRAGGTRAGDMVTIALPNSVDWFVAFAACWALGAVPQPVSSRLPVCELTSIIDLAQPSVVLGVEPGSIPTDRRCLPLGYRPQPCATDDPLPDLVSYAWKAPTSGGSSGRPKLIVSGDPALFDPDEDIPLELRPDGCMIMPGPLYHNGPLVWAWFAVLWGDHVVATPRFDAAQTLSAIETHRADIVYLVPTMMKRIWALGPEVRRSYDLSSLRTVWHLAEPCPRWLKQAWIDWLGADRIWELYGGTEGTGATVISGEEWLRHPGSVGRPDPGTVSIRDEAGQPVPNGVEGEVWQNALRDTPPYHYVGAEPRTLAGGWESLGDMGWLDDDGYLYLGDRAADMIVVGGANTYPAEIEANLLRHPLVRSCAVIGLPDDDRGTIVHAIVEADPVALPEDELRTFVEQRLAHNKVPRAFEYVAYPLRDDAGKVRRSALRAQRIAGAAGPEARSAGDRTGTSVSP